MSIPDPDPPVEPVLEELPWIRRIVGALVRNDADADDVTQDVVCDLITHPHDRRPRTFASFRAWIRTIARRRVADNARSDVARRARERSIVARTSDLTPEASLERCTRVELVVEAVGQLDEPYRTTILLRYLDELPTSEVARRTGVSERAARDRIQTALVILRRRLEKRSGSDLVSWAPLILGQITREHAGRSVMIKIAATVLAVALVGVTWEGTRPATKGSRPIAAESAPLRAEPQSETVPDSSTPVVASAIPLPVATKREAVVSKWSGLVVSDETSAPISAAHVELVDVAMSKIARDTDAEGRFDMPSDDIQGRWLHVDAPGFFPLRLEPASVDAALHAPAPSTLRLAIPGSLRVRVLSNEGEPIERVPLRVELADPKTGLPDDLAYDEWPLEFNWQPRTDVRGKIAMSCFTDARGECVIEPLPCGRDLVVIANGTVPETLARARIDTAARKAEVEMRVSRFGEIRGRLVYPSGSSAGAWSVRVLDPWNLRNNGRAGVWPDGHFVIPGLPFRSVSWWIEAPGENVRATLVDRAVVDVGDVVLPEMGEVSGVVKGAATEASKCSFVDLYAMRNGKILSELHHHMNMSGEFDALMPLGPIDLVMTNGGLPIQTLHITVPAKNILMDADAATGSLSLAGAESFRGGNPTIMLREVDSALRQGGWKWSTQMFGLHDCRDFVSWKEDRLVVVHLAPGDYDGWLRDEEVKGAWSPLGPIHIRAGDVTAADVDTRHLGSIRGTIHTPAGKPIAGCDVSILQAPFETWRADVTRTSNAEGRFEFSSLPPGEWIVFPTRRGLHDEHRLEITLTTERPSAEVKLLVGDLRSIRVHVTQQGVPVSKALAIVWPRQEAWDQRSQVEKNTDGTGFAEFDALPSGAWTVTVGSPGSGMMQGFDYLRQQYVQLSVGGELDVQVEMNAYQRTFQIVRDQRVVADVVGGKAFTREGNASLHAVPGEPGVLRGPVEPGRAVIAIQTASQAGNDAVDRPQGMYFALAEAHDAVGGAFEVVEIAGQNLRVDLDDAENGLVFPEASITEIDGIPVRAGCVAFTDEDAAHRTYACIPPHSRVRIKQYWRDASVDVLTSSSPLTPVHWPPR